MQDQSYQVSEENTERKYFTMMPNFIDEMDLSVYAYRLYGHLRRLAANGSKIHVSLNTLAKNLGMSKGSVHNAKQQLIDKKLIDFIEFEKGGFQHHAIVVLDVWRENIEHFNRSSDDTGSPHDQCTRSPHEPVLVHHMTTTGSPHDRYKESIKKDKDSIYSHNSESEKFSDNQAKKNTGSQKAEIKIAELQKRILVNEKFLFPVLTRLKLTLQDFRELAALYAHERWEDPPLSDDHLRKSFRHYLDNARNILKDNRTKQGKAAGPPSKNFDKFQYPE
jgi:DNA-binding transcriptional regulator GbsR (MarR family)